MSRAPSGRGEPVVVFLDPTRRPDYVRDFVRVFWGRWNLRSVLLYSRRTSRARIAQTDATIGHAGVAGRLRGDLSDLALAAQVLRRKHPVQGVVPQSEAVVVPAAELGELLGTQGLTLDVATRFRDKYRLKSMLRNAPDGPRMNLSTKVTSVPQVMSFVQRHGVDTFVLKPNDGCGNSHVSFFSADSSPADLEAYFANSAGFDVLLEEFIEGHEFCVNGQVTEDGRVITYSVQRTEHRPANGYPNLAGGFHILASTTSEFATAAGYAAQVLSTAGLRSSPFHMEIKIGPDGPCLIEVAARLGGAGIPSDTKLAHGGQVDLFTEAARCYAALPGAPAQPDWSQYDRSVVLTVLGAASRDERVVRLRGVDKVEQLPEFAYWVRPPELGQRISRTTDLSTSPWQVTLQAESEPQVRQAEHHVRQAIDWNWPVAPPERVPDRVRARAAWLRRRSPMLSPLLTAPPKRLSMTSGAR